MVFDLQSWTASFFLFLSAYVVGFNSHLHLHCGCMCQWGGVTGSVGHFERFSFLNELGVGWFLLRVFLSAALKELSLLFSPGLWLLLPLFTSFISRMTVAKSPSQRQPVVPATPPPPPPPQPSTIYSTPVVVGLCISLIFLLVVLMGAGSI